MRRSDYESWLSDIEADALPSTEGPRTRSSLEDDYSDVGISDVGTARPAAPEPQRLAVTDEVADKSEQVNGAEAVVASDVVAPVESPRRDAHRKKSGVASFWRRRTKTEKILFAGIVMNLIGLAVFVPIGDLNEKQKKNDATAQDPFRPNVWYTLASKDPESTDSNNVAETYYFQLIRNETAGISQIFPLASTLTVEKSPPDTWFQILGVPSDHENATIHPDGWDQPARLYWMSCRVHGPDYRLDLTEPPIGPAMAPLRATPKDESHMGQYIFFQEASLSWTGKQLYKVFNWYGGLTAPAKFFVPSAILFSEHVVNTLLIEDWWVQGRDPIEPDDGGFTWITDS